MYVFNNISKSSCDLKLSLDQYHGEYSTTYCNYNVITYVKVRRYEWRVCGRVGYCSMDAAVADSVVPVAGHSVDYLSSLQYQTNLLMAVNWVDIKLSGLMAV